MRVLTKERIIESQDIEFTNESVIRVKENKLYYKVDNDMEIIKRQFLLVTKRLYGKEWEWSIGQIKTCRKKQHVKIDDIKEMSDLICSKTAVGENYNSTRDNWLIISKA